MWRLVKIPSFIAKQIDRHIKKKIWSSRRDEIETIPATIKWYAKCALIKSRNVIFLTCFLWNHPNNWVLNATSFPFIVIDSIWDKREAFLLIGLESDNRIKVNKTVQTTITMCRKTPRKEPNQISRRKYWRENIGNARFLINNSLTCIDCSPICTFDSDPKARSHHLHGDVG